MIGLNPIGGGWRHDRQYDDRGRSGEERFPGAWSFAFRRSPVPDNAFIEAFNGRFRAECLNQHWSMTLADAREKMEDWRRDYNEFRPHGAIGNNVPISLMNLEGVTSPPP